MASLNLRLKYILFMAIGVAGSVALSTYFEVYCNEQIYMPMMLQMIKQPLLVLEAGTWSYVAVGVFCILLIYLQFHNGAATLASQLFFVVFLMVMAAVTFYSNAHRYYGQCNSKLRFKNLPVNHTKGGRLAQDELRKEIRRRGVEFYHFFDNFQRSHKCCGMSRYSDWNAKEVQYFLHTDYTNSCTPFTDTGKPEKCCFTIPKYCKRIFTQDDHRIPASCCKDKSSSTCMKAQFNDNESKTYVHQKSCGRVLRNTLGKCHSAVIFPTALSFFLSVYFLCVTCGFLRASQKRSFWTGCCCCGPKQKRVGPLPSTSIFTQFGTKFVPSRRFRTKSKVVRVSVSKPNPDIQEGKRQSTGGGTAREAMAVEANPKPSS